MYIPLVARRARARRGGGRGGSCRRRDGGSSAGGARASIDFHPAGRPPSSRGGNLIAGLLRDVQLMMIPNSDVGVTDAALPPPTTEMSENESSSRRGGARPHNGEDNRYDTIRYDTSDVALKAVTQTSDLEGAPSGRAGERPGERVGDDATSRNRYLRTAPG